MKEERNRDDVARQAAVEMGKKGRDGAYMEIDLSGQPDLGRLCEAKMVVISGYRLELSDEAQVTRWKVAVDKAILNGETMGMDNAQVCLHVVRNVFEAGLKITDKGVDIGAKV